MGKLKRWLFGSKPTITDIMAASHARTIAVIAHDIAKAAERTCPPSSIISHDVICAGLAALPDWLDDAAEANGEDLGLLVASLYTAMCRQQVFQESRPAKQ